MLETLEGQFVNPAHILLVWTFNGNTMAEMSNGKSYVLNCEIHQVIKAIEDLNRC